MSDFETRLRAGLQRLEAAVPPPKAPLVTPRPSTGSRRRRQVILLLVAVVALLAATSLGTTAILSPPDPAQVAKDAADEERLRNDLGEHTADACLSEAQITALIRERLDALGLADWTVRADGRYRESPCVGAAPIGDAHEVLLMPSMGGVIATALDALGPTCWSGVSAGTRRPRSCAARWRVLASASRRWRSVASGPSRSRAARRTSSTSPTAASSSVAPSSTRPAATRGTSAVAERRSLGCSSVAPLREHPDRRGRGGTPVVPWPVRAVGPMLVGMPYRARLVPGCPPSAR